MTLHEKQAETVVWVLSDGLPGHVNQSRGIVKALQEKAPSNFQSHEINISLKYKFLRPLLRFLANKPSKELFQKVCHKAYNFISPTQTSPDLIISTGGNTLPLNIALSQQYQCTNVFSGTLKGYLPALVNINFSVAPLNHPNNYLLDLPPSIISHRQSTETKPTPRLYGLFIGGKGAGYEWGEEDFSQLANAINHLSKKHDLKWLITTSRRTGIQIEQWLQGQLKDEHIKRAVWFSQSEDKVVQTFLQQCEATFVTEDSLTMIAEGIMAGKPVVTLQPQTMLPIAYDTQTLDTYKKKRFISRQKVSDLERLDILSLKPHQVPDVANQIRKALAPYLSDASES